MTVELRALSYELRVLLLVLVLEMAAPSAVAQSKGGAASQGTVSSSPREGHGDSAMKSSAGVLVDQVVAVVNDDLILESDVDEAKRFHAFHPLEYAGAPFDRDRAVEQLVNQTLILQQARLQPDSATSPADVQKQIALLRKELPACQEYQCDTDAGWARFVHDQGFTTAELDQQIARQLTIVRFTEMRFRMGIRIPPADVDAYYKNTLLPEYGRLHAPAPKEDVLADRIQQILLEQQVNSLLGDWLKSLKAQGSVRIMRPGEVQP